MSRCRALHRALLVLANVLRETAFGVFLRLQVTNFDVFLGLFRHISFLVLGCWLFLLFGLRQ